MERLIKNLFIRSFAPGDKVKVISFPRFYDYSDAYAGVSGIIEDIEFTDKFNNGTGIIIIKMDSGATFVGTGIIERCNLIKLL